MKNVRFYSLLAAISILFCSFIPADWIDFQNKEGNFKILFPRQPEVSENTKDTQMGKLNMKIFMYEVDKFKDDNALYGIIFTDYPDTMVNSDFKDDILDRFFEGGINGAAKNMKGTVLTQKKSNYKEYPGVRAKISFANGEAIMYMQMFIVNSRGYILEVACEPKSDNNPSIDKFFNSFALLTEKK